MTEVPEHLLKRSQAAKDAKAGVTPTPDMAEQLRLRPDERKITATNLVVAISRLENVFGVGVVVVPEGMKKDDAEAALKALAPLGDMSHEFLSGLASLVIQNTPLK